MAESCPSRLAQQPDLTVLCVVAGWLRCAVYHRPWQPPDGTQGPVPAAAHQPLRQGRQELRRRERLARHAPGQCSALWPLTFSSGLPSMPPHDLGRARHPRPSSGSLVLCHMGTLPAARMPIYCSSALATLTMATSTTHMLRLVVLRPSSVVRSGCCCSASSMTRGALCPCGALQVLQHWGYVLTEKDFKAYAKEKGYDV